MIFQLRCSARRCMSAPAYTYNMAQSLLRAHAQNGCIKKPSLILPDILLTSSLVGVVR